MVDIKELQNEEIVMLKEFLKIIEKHALRYYILGGTLLGAVRHKGFIPWDDDVDIGMPRDDYERFLKIAASELPENMGVLHFKMNPQYKRYGSRLINKNIVVTRADGAELSDIHLWIDIMPLDGMPNTYIFRTIHMLVFLYKRLLFKYSDTKINVKKKRPLHEKVLIALKPVFSHLFHLDVDKRLLAIDVFLKKYQFDESKYVANFMGAYKFKEILPRAYFEPSKLFDFETIQLVGLGEYDKMLSRTYGRYMELPPEDKRNSHSIIKFEKRDTASYDGEE